ncbi:DUF6119 family protein [Sporolactobacillus sp. STCC-11]|uniref:DUF6119 family protein n=1 Tax=Sporolactobacillus caesalpiniae TaxID=3230362 RepID=UPI003392546F
MNSSRFEAQTQFSIYKIDIEVVEKVFSLHEENVNKAHLLKVMDVILKSVVALVNKKNKGQYQVINLKKIKGIVFKTSNEPVWKNMIVGLINQIDISHNTMHPNIIENSSVSYILLHAHNKSIYAMSAGYGSNYINKFVDKNFGLYLIPKIVTRDKPIVKQVLENNLTGNRISTQRANRNNTSFVIEQDVSSIYKELDIQISRQIADQLGISFDVTEPQNKKLTIVNKDSINIRRSFTISQIISVIHKIDKLQSKEDNFALNYLILAKKLGIKNSELIDQLVGTLKNKDFSKFMLVGEDFEKYYFNASCYEILKPDGSIFISKNEPIELWELFNLFEKKEIELTKKFMEELLKKWLIQTKDNAGNILLYPITILNTLQGYIEYGESKRPYYLINGMWYVFDKVYTKILDENYKSFFDKKECHGELINRFSLKKVAKNEDLYNKQFKKNNKIIFAHTVLSDNVEIADLIFFDKDFVYLMCNKSSFSGAGARDLTNQIITSSEYLQKMLNYNRISFLENYYNNICKKNDVEIYPDITLEGFINTFNKRICYVAGFLKGYSRGSKATYSKYLMLELNKKLEGRGQMLIPLNII